MAEACVSISWIEFPERANATWYDAVLEHSATAETLYPS